MPVERGAGVVTGYPDTDFEQSKAMLMDNHAAFYTEADLVVKVKEQLPEEYSLMRPGQVLFTYFHLAASRELTEAVCRSAVTAAAYETIEVNGRPCRFSKQPKAVQRTSLHDAVATINAPLLCRSHSAKRIDRPLPPLPAVINSPDAKGRDCGHPQGERGVP